MAAGRLDELAMHPTPKPVAMVADAIKDCSNRNGIILDPFMGSGTTLIAAERTGRRAAASSLTLLMSTSRSGAGRHTPASARCWSPLNRLSKRLKKSAGRLRAPIFG